MPRLATVGAVIFLRWSGAGAWSPKGHERIARIAQALLPGKHRDQIRTMMHGDVIDQADWEEKMTKEHPETDALHWHRQDQEWACEQVGGLGDKSGHLRCDGSGMAEKGELFCALAYFFEHFAHDLLLKEFPEPEEPIGTPSSLQALQRVPQSELTSASYLRWLAILVGDLHQPLHWLKAHNFGKDVIIRFRGEEHTLKAFWEDYLPTHLHKMQSDKKKETEYPTLAVFEKKVPQELFRDWARDSAEKLCTEVYAPMTVNHADGARVDSPFTLTEDLFEKWVKLAEGLMALGGERLAFVLNDILEHKRHKEALKDGRGLHSIKSAIGTELVNSKTKASVSLPAKVRSGEDDGSVSPHKLTDADAAALEDLERRLKILETRRSNAHAMTNLGIAVVVVPTLLLVLNWHRKIGGGSIFGFTKHLKY